MLTDIVTVLVALCCGVPESVTTNVNGVAASAVVAVPLITPVAELSFSPEGSVPEVNCQLYGVTPPVAVSVIEHADPTLQLRETLGAVVSWVMTARVNDFEAVCATALESVTIKVSGVAVTADVGVPLIAPVAELRFNPAGSVPAVNCQVYGVVPPAAARVCA